MNEYLPYEEIISLHRARDTPLNKGFRGNEIPKRHILNLSV